ncbi:LysR family transcriptional regulator [Mumia sp. DW29H23]|uniref:LysR family transcriptional regulator n=1 Tax=Mumia sp. DW29H23 TaxID=3421241 RepID=UPI003D691ABD
MLDVRRLRLLRELALRGTLAQVADALHQSPSSVSQQLAQLEREVGVPLLIKAGRGVRLTPQAEILVEHTEAVLAGLERAESDVAASLVQPSGSVRVAVFQSAALALLPAALTWLEAEHPALRVTVVQREPETALAETWARDFDLVVAEEYPHHAAPRHPGLDRLPLTTDTLWLAVSPDAPEHAAIERIEDAARVPWVMEPVGAASRHWAEQACRRAGFEPDVRFETADLQAHLRLVQSGHAVALLPDILWKGLPAPARLCPLPGDPQRSIFTSARLSAVASPGVASCRRALAHAAESPR